jgi:hypothetical protein
MICVRFHQVGQIINSEGLLRFDGEQFCLEYRLVDGILGVAKSGVKEVNIPLADLVSVDLTRGWFGGRKIVMQARTMKAVENAPGMSQGRIELVVARSDREIAQKLVGGLFKPGHGVETGLEY